MSQAAVEFLAILAAMDASPTDAAALLALSGQRPAIVLQVICQRPTHTLNLPVRRSSNAERSRTAKNHRAQHWRRRK